MLKCMVDNVYSGNMIRVRMYESEEVFNSLVCVLTGASDSWHNERYLIEEVFGKEVVIASVPNPSSVVLLKLIEGSDEEYEEINSYLE